MRVLGREVATRDDAHAERVEPARADDLKSDVPLGARRRDRLAFGEHRRAEVVAADRQRDCAARGANVGQRPDRREHLFEECDLPRLVFRACADQRDVERQEILRIEADVDASQAQQALAEERGADDERDGERDLARHERGEIRAASRARRRTCAAPPSAVRARDERRHESEREAAGQDEGGRDQEHRQIDRDGVEPARPLGASATSAARLTRASATPASPPATASRSPSVRS